MAKQTNTQELCAHKSQNTYDSLQDLKKKNAAKSETFLLRSAVYISVHVHKQASRKSQLTDMHNHETNSYTWVCQLWQSVGKGAIVHLLQKCVHANKWNQEQTPGDA